MVYSVYTSISISVNRILGWRDQCFRAWLLSFHGEKNELYRVQEELVSSGARIVGLVKGNVNEHKICYPEGTLRSILGEAVEKAKVCHPDSLGQINQHNELRILAAAEKLARQESLIHYVDSVDSENRLTFVVGRLMEFLTALGQDVQITVKPSRKRKERGEVSVVLT